MTTILATRMFRFIHDEVADLAKNLKVIITEHADHTEVGLHLAVRNRRFDLNLPHLFRNSCFTRHQHRFHSVPTVGETCADKDVSDE